jgi:hypothetical protein
MTPLLITQFTTDDPQERVQQFSRDLQTALTAAAQGIPSRVICVTDADWQELCWVSAGTDPIKIDLVEPETQIDSPRAATSEEPEECSDMSSVASWTTEEVDADEDALTADDTQLVG